MAAGSPRRRSAAPAGAIYAAGNWTQQDALNAPLDRTAAFSLLTAPNAVAGIVAAVAFGAATERSPLGLTGPGCGLLGGFFGFAVTTALESLDVSVRG